MSNIYFASAHVKSIDRNASLPAKFARLLPHCNLERFKDKRVAVKMHVGGDIGYYTIHPLFVRMVVDAIRAAGGHPFLTDGSFSTDAAVARGYTPEVVHARVVGAGGEHPLHVLAQSCEVGGKDRRGNQYGRRGSNGLGGHGVADSVHRRSAG